MADANRFESVIEQIDRANSEDPTIEDVEGSPQPKELIYGRRMSDRLATFAPDASEALRIASRAQHIRRWHVPRDTYPRDRKGYRAWREYLYTFHADQAASLMRHVGYDDATIERVRDLLQKKRLKADADMQTLEDVICLVFLEFYFEPFIDEHRGEDDKIIRILQRTWAKMSGAGHAAALDLPLDGEAKRLIEAALA